MTTDEQPKPEPFWKRLFLRLMRQPADDRETIAAVSRKWLPFCTGLITILTFGWTWIIYNETAGSGEYHGVIQVTIAVVKEASPAAALILLYSLSITYALDIVGGMIMVTARYLGNKFVRPLIEQYRKEGREEAYRKWETWNRNRIEAEKKGVSFDEPPPSSHSETPTNGR
ncbi:MAG: hypothetical protein OXC95_08485 [Dehalococcoidia bacterium]|nr:hypothetical protein [Dehalococcoidia bacterium]